MSAPSKASVRQKRQPETQAAGPRAAVLRGSLTGVAPEGGRQDGAACVEAIDELPVPAQTLTQKFEAYLKGRGETRRQVANRAGVAAYTLSRLFPKRSNRKREFFSRRTLQAICHATEGHISWQDLASLARPYIPQNGPRPLTLRRKTCRRSPGNSRPTFKAKGNPHAVRRTAWRHRSLALACLSNQSESDAKTPWHRGGASFLQRNRGLSDADRLSRSGPMPGDGGSHATQRKSARFKDWPRRTAIRRASDDEDRFHHAREHDRQEPHSAPASAS